MAPSPKPDRGASIFVLSVWAGMLAWALLYVRAFAPTFPFGDEFALWDLLPPAGKLSFETLWRLRNEHRIPLPRLVQYVPYVLTGDLRAPMFVQVLVLGAIALLLIGVARRIRGRTTWSDAFFPLVWLHVGNWFNLLSGFQIALTLPTAFATTILAALVISPERVGRTRADVAGASLVCLPLCGAAGLTQVPAFAACLAWIGFSGLRSADSGARAGGRVLLASVCVCAAICGMHAVGYSPPHWYPYSTSPSAVLDVVAKLLAFGLGPVAVDWWPASGILVLVAIASALILLARAAATEPGERRVCAALLASIAAIVCLAASIGVGRAAVGPNQGFAARYVTLSTPLWCAVYVAWVRYGRSPATSVACGALACVAFLALPWNARTGWRNGLHTRSDVERFERVVASGATLREIVASYTEILIYHHPESSRWILRTLALRREPPFEHGRAFEAAEFDYLTFSRPPSRVDSDDPPAPRFVDERHVVMVPVGARLVFDVQPGDARISGRFGIPSELSQKKSGGVRMVVEVVPHEGPARVLFDRTLDPVSLESDRGSIEFAVDAGDLPPGEIVLRTEMLRPTRKIWSWSYWSDVRIER